MPRPKGSPNKQPRRVRIEARLPDKQAKWLKKLGTTETMERIVEDAMNDICVTLSEDEDGFLGNDPVSIAQIDVDESKQRYMAAVRAEVMKEFPRVTRVRFDWSGGNNNLSELEDALFDAGEDNSQVASDFFELEERVYGAQDFWVPSKFGSVQFLGATYYLTEQAECSNRVFPGWFGDASEGERYTSEWQASAVGQDGHSYMVVWQFTDVKGQEPEDASNYPWHDEYITSVDPQ